MPQRDRKKIEGQLRAIKEHEQKKAAYPRKEDKAFADKTIRNAERHLNKLRNR